MSDVGTTPRKPLSPRQLLKLWEREKGICCICGFPIPKDKKWAETLKGPKGFIDEHKRALGLGGGNEAANRGIAHSHCADVKTREQDMPRINKAKDQKQRDLGISSAKSKFAKPEKPKRESRAPANGLSEIARRYR